MRARPAFRPACPAPTGGSTQPMSAGWSAFPFDSGVSYRTGCALRARVYPLLSQTAAAVSPAGSLRAVRRPARADAGDIRGQPVSHRRGDHHHGGRPTVLAGGRTSGSHWAATTASRASLRSAPRHGPMPAALATPHPTPNGYVLRCPVAHTAPRSARPARRACLDPDTA